MVELIIMIKNIKTYGATVYQLHGSLKVLWLSVFKRIKIYFILPQYFITSILFISLSSFSDTHELSVNPELLAHNEVDTFQNFAEPFLIGVVNTGAPREINSFPNFIAVCKNGKESNSENSVLIACTLTVTNACVGGGTVTFTQNNDNNNNGTWTVTGGTGVKSGSRNFIFTPGSNAGCFSASYHNGGCTASANFVIFPPAPVITEPESSCASMFDLPSVPAKSGFNIQYKIDAGAFSTSPSTTTPGCHTVQARYVLASNCGSTTSGTAGTGSCGVSNTVSVAIFPAAPTIANISNTCNSALGSITAVSSVSGFTAEYAVQPPGGSISSYGTLGSANALLTNTPGCWTVYARYKIQSACGSTPANSISSDSNCQEGSRNAVVFPSAPVITSPPNSCISTFSMPTVTDISGFDVQYSIDGGAFSSSPTTPTPGCHTVRARYVVDSNCGSTTSSTQGPGSCGTSNSVNVVIFPASPAMTPLANKCNAALSSITAVTTVSGFTAEYAVQPPGGSLSAYGTLTTANGMLTNTKGCWTVKARYKLAAACGSTPANSISSDPDCQETTINAIVFPTAPVITTPAIACAEMFDLPSVPDIAGFDVQITLDNGASWSVSPSTTTPGCYQIMARYATSSACGSIPAGTANSGSCGSSNLVYGLIFPPAPVLTPLANTCNSKLANITAIPTIAGFTAEYAVAPPLGSLSAYGTLATANAMLSNNYGCWIIKARYKITASCGSTTPGLISTWTACQEGTIYAVDYPPSPVITAPANKCASMFTLPTVPAINGFTVQYSINGGTSYSTNPSTITPGCYTVLARYILTSDCGTNLAGSTGTGSCAPSNAVNVVIFPPAPVLSVPSNSCFPSFNLPTVTAYSGFSVEYSIDGGSYTSTPSAPAIPGCHTIQLRYVVSSACGSTPQGSAGPGTCGASNIISEVQFPAAPTITTPANTCNSAFVLPSVPDQTALGFTTRYSIDGSPYVVGPTIPTTPGCHTIQAQYSLTAACGTNGAGLLSPGSCAASNMVSVVIYPTAPVITAPANTCASAFSLPSVTAVSGFTAQYSIDGGPFSASPSVSVVPGCHTIQAQYALTSICGTTAAGSAGTGTCGVSNIVNVVIFPTAPPAPTVSSGCGLFTVTPPASVSGFNIQYSFDNGATWGANTPPTADNCTGYFIKTRYVTAAACGPIPAGTASVIAACKESAATIRAINQTFPVLSGVPADTSAECSGIFPPALVTAIDVCSGLSLSVVFSSVIASDSCNGIYLMTRTWTATNACGNSSSASQVITFASLNGPVITGIPADTTADCLNIPIPAPVTASDYCSNVPIPVFLTTSTTPGSCPGNYILIRIWTATDVCGNTSTGEQQITVTDITAPVLTCPPAQTLCEVVSHNYTIPPLVATDDCTADSLLTITFQISGATTRSGTGKDASGMFNVGTSTITWTVSDGCGNTSTCSTTVSMDKTVPTIICQPLNFDGCDASSLAPYANLVAFIAGGGFVSDNFQIDSSSFQLINQTTNGGNCPVIVTRTYQIADICGNTSTCNQIISVLDQTPPTMSCPPNVTVICEEDLPSPYSNLGQYLAAGGTVSDQCGYVSASFKLTSETLLNNTCPKNIERIYEITDLCGNTGYCTQNDFISDNIPPQIFGIPPNVDIQCQDCIQSFQNGDFELPVLFPLPWAYLNENVVPGWETTSPTNIIEIQRSGQVDGVISYSGNQHAELNGDQTGDFYQVFCTIPTTILHISFAHHLRMASKNTTDDIMEVFCGPDFLHLTSMGLFTATRTSGWTVHTVVYPVPSGQTSTIFLFRAVQSAPTDVTYGNLIDAVNVVTLLDPTYIPSATDNCDGVAVVSSEQNINGSCGGHFQLFRTYTAIDKCGNQTVSTQTISVGDFLAPVFSSQPTDTTVTYCSIPVAPTITAYDSCAGSVPVVYTEVTSSGCSYTITRNWSAGDECGNNTSMTQTIHVTPPSTPVIINPPPDTITITCNDAPSFQPGNLQYSNSESGLCLLEGSMAPTLNGSFNECGGVLTVVWDTSLVCGVSFSHTQTVFVQPLTEPVFINTPSDTTLSCNIAPTFTAAPLAYTNAETGACEVSGTVQPVVEQTWNQCGGTITVTWDTTLACSYVLHYVQTITIEPSPAPAFINTPNDTTISCADATSFITAASALIYTNNATGPCEVSGSVQPLIAEMWNECGGTITITWDTVLICNQPLYYFQTIIVEPAPAPAFVNTPNDTTISCGDASAFVAAGNSLAYTNNASGACEISGSITPVIAEAWNVCGGTISITWDAVVMCDNNLNYVQTVQVEPAPAPTFINTPNDTTIACEDAAAYASSVSELTYTNGASGSCEITGTVLPVIVEAWGTCGGTIQISWGAVLNCNYAVNYTQNIVVQPTQPPVFLNTPNDTTILCVDAPAYIASVGELMYSNSAFGSCLSSGTVEPVVVEDWDQCGGTITITWDTTVACSNTLNYVQTITIEVPVPSAPVSTSDRVDCYSDIILPTPPQVFDTCGTELNPTGPVESAPPGCDGDIFYTWTYSNCNGDSINYVHVVTIARPMLTLPPPVSDTINCFADVVMPAPPQVFDACGNVLTPTGPIESSVPTCAGDVTFTWTFTDCVGNTADWVYTYTVISPAFNLPADTGSVVSCFAEARIIPTPPLLSNSCGDSLVISGPVISADPVCSGIKTYTWTYTNCTGSSEDWVYTYTVNDTISPVITCPGDLTFECAGDVPAGFATYVAFVAGGGSASDNCGLDETTFTFTETDLGTCPRVITRTYSIADSCGNVSQCIQTITVSDITAPVITCPGDLTFECAGDVPAGFATYVAFVAGGGSASDNCGLDETTFTFTETDLGTCPRVITRTYSIADSCGNVSQCVQTITVSDITAPVITCPGDLTFECAGDVPAGFATYVAFVAGGGSASDNCGLDETTFTFTETDLGTCPRVITRTYSIADSCGNVSQCIQTITVSDITAPVITCPGDLTFECAGDVPAGFATYVAFVAGGGSASDNCGLDETTFTFTETDLGTCPRVITRTYSIADSCGNVSQCIQTITVSDITAPVITCPGDLTFECAGDVPAGFATYVAFVAGGGSASDNCGLDETTFTFTETDLGTCPRVITRTYSIADSCGNVSQCLQTITVSDITAPVITCPGDLTFECAGDVPAGFATYVAFVAGGGSASDNCGLDETTFTFTETDLGTCPRVITRTYSIADSCGNVSQCIQTITVSDITAPVITCPGDLTFECAGDVPAGFATYVAFVAGGGSASDNCGLDETTFTFTETDLGTCPRVITRTYSIADSCGNVSQCIQTITVSDITAPVITCPGDLTFECAGDVPAGFATYVAFVAGGGSASDNCGLDETTFTFTETDLGTCPRVITRTYSIADSCGNVSQCVQTITVSDITAPVITCPGDLTFECAGDVPAGFATYVAFVAGGGSASDNCGLDETTFTFTETDLGTCPRVITRTYSIADSCGNVSQCIQTITVSDITAPVITCPGDLTFECAGDVPAGFATYVAFVAGGGSASDNCGLDETTFTFTETDLGTCPRVITRTYSIADSCGNVSQCIQTITVSDITAPVITCPGDLTFECAGDVPAGFATYVAFVAGGGSASDNCGLDETTFTFTETDLGTCPRVITRTYSIADSCGNVSQCIQTITVSDITAPVITCPGDLTFECAGDVPAGFATYVAFVAGGGSASDNCGLDETTFTFTETDLGTCPRVITRTYSIADSCGNVSQCIQTITVSDITAPVITCPGDLTFECAGDVPAGFATYVAFVAGGGSASDNCGLDETTFTYTETDLGTCPRVITRTYSIADSCGNVSQCVQTITVSDITAPVITCPGDLTFECAGDVPAGFATYVAFVAGGGSASDNCGLDETTFTFTETDLGTCPRVITRTYSIADSCGNVSQCVQTITVSDITAPVITCPGDLTFECAGDVPAGFATYVAFVAGGGSASDNCGLDETTFTFTETDLGTCPRVITRTYSIADSCGNVSQCIQTITVSDITAPVITCPGDLTFECAGDVPAGFATYVAFVAGGGSASDNCGLDETTFTFTETDLGTCPRVITRTYSIADSCGNVSQCIQTITVSDITAPVITCPGDLTFECAGDVPAGFATYVAFVAGGGSASDNCGLDETTFTFTETDLGTCPRVITRTYSIADSCGNVSQCIQTITVSDITAPVITCPGDLTFECAGDVPAGFATYVAFVAGGGSASDNCGLDETTFTFTETDLGTCPRVITRTYSIADSCGNVSQCIQTITVSDITAPVITCPGDLTFECAGDVPAGFATYVAFVAGGGSASDNCGLG